LLAVCLGPALPGAEGPNIVPNPGFEKGKEGPEFWALPDKLTSFWETGGVKGKCIRMDTDVYRSEWAANHEKPGSVTKKTITSGLKYDTVGGTTGVALYSYPIPVDLDAWYVVEYDSKGPGGEVFIYLKGYTKVRNAEEAAMRGAQIFFRPEPNGAWFSEMVKGTVGEDKRPPQPGDYLQMFRRRFITKLGPEAATQWQHHKGVVLLPMNRRIEVVLLELYAYWPPGDYFFDNVSMRKITEAEAYKIDPKAAKRKATREAGEKERDGISADKPAAPNGKKAPNVPAPQPNDE